MNSWQRKMYDQLACAVLKGVPSFTMEEYAIKFTPTQAYLIKTTIDDLEREVSDLEEKLIIYDSLIAALKKR